MALAAELDGDAAADAAADAIDVAAAAAAKADATAPAAAGAVTDAANTAANVCAADDVAPDTVRASRILKRAQDGVALLKELQAELGEGPLVDNHGKRCSVRAIPRTPRSGLCLTISNINKPMAHRMTRPCPATPASV